MQRSLLILSLFVVPFVITSCNLDPRGKPCEEDKECGSGFDCYRDSCIQVCTKDDECSEGETCYRYHCMVKGQENTGFNRSKKKKRSPPPAPRAKRAPPAAPSAGSATVAELRAIRRQIELMRNEQAALRRAIEALSKQNAPAETTKPVQKTKAKTAETGKTKK
ncbi:hypothetical protein KAI87_01830 [Myxococcota bacterium]|nr:hypothetical protein [Myxococcota bacterium]